MNPKTPAQWQEAVDLAHGCLCLDSARQYGLVQGGPGVDVERCADIIAKGKAMGIVPSVDAVGRFAIALAKGKA